MEGWIGTSVSFCGDEFVEGVVVRFRLWMWPPAEELQLSRVDEAAV